MVGEKTKRSAVAILLGAKMLFSGPWDVAQLCAPAYLFYIFSRNRCVAPLSKIQWMFCTEASSCNTLCNISRSYFCAEESQGAYCFLIRWAFQGSCKFWFLSVHSNMIGLRELRRLYSFYDWKSSKYLRRRAKHEKPFFFWFLKEKPHAQQRFFRVILGYSLVRGLWCRRARLQHSLCWPSRRRRVAPLSSIQQSIVSRHGVFSRGALSSWPDSGRLAEVYWAFLFARHMRYTTVSVAPFFDAEHLPWGAKRAA